MQKPLYGDELEESPVDEEQHLIKENMMEDLLYNFNDSDTIVLYPAAINIYYIKEIKKDLRCNKWIIRLTVKVMETVEVSAAHIIIYIL